MRFADLFCGIGGFRLGMERHGFDCVFSCDINEKCRETYFANFGDMPEGDITKIEADSIPDFEILCAGFPCQPFSASGKKKGFEDTRGTLFFDICKIIKTKQPKIILLENVKNLKYHDKGNTLKVIISSLEKLGYVVNWDILNASDFGVPQNRERIVIIAFRDASLLNNNSPTELLDKINTSLLAKLKIFELREFEKSKLIDFLDTDRDFVYLNDDEWTRIEDPKIQPSGLIFVGYRNKNIRKRGTRKNTEHLSRVHKQPNRIYSADGVSATISSQETAGRYFILTDEGVRKLTIDECYRIMGFPENFIKATAKTEQYKQIGNSVCVNIIEVIAKALTTC